MCVQVFALGRDNRATGSTRMNIHSSRSHALLCVTVMGVSRTTGMQTTGQTLTHTHSGATLRYTHIGIIASYIHSDTHTLA